jgi:hypothetical protein
LTWSRSHERLIAAWVALHHAHARRGLAQSASPRLGEWTFRKFGERIPARLTIAQARQARRCLNAWRAGVEGRAEARSYPRQWARNARRKRERQVFAPMPPIKGQAEFTEFTRHMTTAIAGHFSGQTATTTATARAMATRNALIRQGNSAGRALLSTESMT